MVPKTPTATFVASKPLAVSQELPMGKNFRLPD